MNMSILKSAEIDFSKETCVIIDANSWVHKCWHACPPTYDKKGVNQSVLHGMFAILNSMTNHLKRTDFIINVFDPPDGDAFRKSIYMSYKANRPPQDPDLKRQKADVTQIFKNIYGLPDVSYPGYEADDTIGSLAKIISKEMQVIIVSADKDLAQLVNRNTYLMRQYKVKGEIGSKYQFMDETIVKEHFGVYPKQIPDYLALMGDTADNLPGIEDVGPKTAVKLINKYIGIDNIIRDPYQLEEKSIREKIIGREETLKIVRDLATIVTDLPVAKHLDDALDHADFIRNSDNYMSNLIKAESYFNLNPYIKNLFL